jgi:hypothetical protein
MSTKTRLQEFVKYKGMGRNRFEESVGISSGYISSRSSSVGSEIVERIARTYKDLNVEWLITGMGKMIKEPYWHEVGTAASGVTYKKLVYAPLVSRYAQTEYILRWDERIYIDTLPTLPVSIEQEGNGSYMCFEMLNDSMNDGSDNSYNVGDILICREIDYLARQKNLYFNKPKSFVIIHQTEGLIVRQITGHNIEDDIITIHSLNPLYEDIALPMSKIKKLFYIFKLQRLVN